MLTSLIKVRSDLIIGQNSRKIKKTPKRVIYNTCTPRKSGKQAADTINVNNPGPEAMLSPEKEKKIEFKMGRGGSRVLWCNGYSFSNNGTYTNRTYWICSKRVCIHILFSYQYFHD
jgi:hypothetical protein